MGWGTEWSRGGYALLTPGTNACSGQTEEKEVWYHEGPPMLKKMRLWTANYALPRAQERLKRQRISFAKPDKERMASKQAVHNTMRTFQNEASQVGDGRPVSYCKFSPDSSMLATASWSGLCKLWSVPDCEPIRSLRGGSRGSLAVMARMGSTAHDALHPLL